ncbi:uncharacterized protein LOC133524795 [Cydia pomonella]|uniref:uncharacterized protein LOC133524795 n=1 Tax=Cydia pomonella TaxID=82600 RepID=UPI002ADD8591|nr:uncharacterized protein LOC133524795 [Cydia pomonella]
MAQLKELKANRGYVKGAISRIETFCISDDFSTSSIEVLTQKKERLIKAFGDYESCNRAILATEPDDSESYEAYETKYDLCLAMINTRLKPATQTISHGTASSELQSEKRAIALEATTTEEPKKPLRSAVSAAAATGVSCVPVCVPTAHTCGSVFGEDKIWSYSRREAALPCRQEVDK